MASKGASGRSPKKPISPPSDEPPTSWEEFRTWFWTRTKGNDLIKYLNDAGKTDYIRRESFKNRPVIYCIALNDGDFPGKTDGVQWKLCKVGFTHCNTQEGGNNRMEQLKDQIISKYASRNMGAGRDAKPSVIFKPAVGAVDSRPYFETEGRIREAMGWPLNKELAKKMGLPCSTEWVLTTQDFIDEVKEGVQTEGIDVFKKPNMKFKERKNDVPPWVKVDQNGKVIGIKH